MTKKPDYSRFEKFGDDVKGYEGINMSTMAIPFIRILQTLSPQLNKRKPDFIPEAEEGDVCNSVSGIIYKQPLKVVIGKFERLFIEWKPNRGGFVAAHAPESVELNSNYVLNEKYQLVDPATNNILIDTYMYYILLPDYVGEGICVISMSSTQLKEAKKLNRLLKTTVLPGTSQKALPHFMAWTLETVEMSNDQGDWFSPKINFHSFVTQEVLDNIVAERKALPDKTMDYAQIEENAGKKADKSDQPLGNVKY